MLEGSAYIDGTLHLDFCVLEGTEIRDDQSNQEAKKAIWMDNNNFSTTGFSSRSIQTDKNDEAKRFLRSSSHPPGRCLSGTSGAC